MRTRAKRLGPWKTYVPPLAPAVLIGGVRTVRVKCVKYCVERLLEPGAIQRVYAESITIEGHDYRAFNWQNCFDVFVGHCLQYHQKTADEVCVFSQMECLAACQEISYFFDEV